jgi:hypothetical protein
MEGNINIMDGGFVTLFLAEIALFWYTARMYIKNQDLLHENERLKEKIGELKEWIKDSK